jgi:hypothetical protein
MRPVILKVQPAHPNPSDRITATVSSSARPSAPSVPFACLRGCWQPTRLLATWRKRPRFLPDYGSAVSSLFSNAVGAVAWFFLAGLPCVLSLDLAMEVTMKVRVNLSMALHVVLRGKSVSKPRWRWGGARRLRTTRE